MTALSLIFDLIGKDNVSPAMHKAGDSAETAGHKISGLGKLAIGGALVAGAVLVGEKLKHIGEEGVDAFREVTGGALGLQRVMGGTVEETSRLAFAAHESGVNADALGIGMRILSKNIGSGGKAFADFGINVKDASGHLLPQQEVLARVADQFAKLPNGPAKSAEALKLFGRQGAALIPLLNKGSEGIKELGKESDKLGLTISGKDATALKQYNLAHRQLGAAMEGVKVSIGRALLPVLATAATAFAANGVKIAELVQGAMRPLAAVAGLVGSTLTTYVLPALFAITAAIEPAVQAGKAFVDALPPPVMQALGAAVGLLVIALGAQAAITAAAAAVTGLFAVTVNAETGATERGVVARLAHNIATAASTVVHVAAAAAAGVWTAAQWLLNAALDANPIGLLVVAIAALVGGLILAYQHSETFRNIVQGAMQAVTTAANAVLDFFRDHWPLMLALLAGPIGLAVLEIVRHWDAIKSGAQTAWNAIKSVITTALDAIRAVIDAVWTGIKTAVTAYLDAVKLVVTTYFNAYKTVIETILHAIEAVVTTAWDGIKATVSAVLTALETAVTTSWNGIKAAFAAALSVIRTVVDREVNGIRTAFSNGVAAFAGDARTAWNAVNAVFTAATIALHNVVWTALNSIVALFRGLGGLVRSAVGDLSSVLLDAGKAVIDGFIHGVENGFDRVKSTFTHLTSLIPSWKGPPATDATILFGAGQLVMGGFVNGLRAEFGTVRSTLADATGLLDVGPLSVSGTGAGDGVGAHFDRLGDRLEKAMKEQVRDQVLLARSGT